MSRNARIFRHPGDRLGVQIQSLVAAQASAHQLGPAIAGKVAGKKRALAAHLLARGVNVVHELVDERNGNLLHLAFRVGHLADEDVAGRVNAAFGSGIKHIVQTVSYRILGNLINPFTLYRQISVNEPEKMGAIHGFFG